MAGEIALERLQRGGESRIATGEREFSNHFDLAAHLLAEAGPIPSGSAADTALGRVDLLFELLKQVGLATPSQLQPYVAALHGDIERRPLADQIIDQLLAEDEARYKIYEDIRTNRPTPGDSEPPERDEEQRAIDKALGFFVAQWIAFERAVRRITLQRGYNPTAPFPSFRMLDKIGVLDEKTRKEVEFIRRMRNNVVHGIETPDSASLEDAGERIQAITAALNSNPPVDP